MRLTRGLGVVFMLAAASCGGDRTAAQEAVKRVLHDPDSARFGSLTRVGETGLCVTVNARDRSGEYVGDLVAIVRKYEGQWVSGAEFVESHQRCAELLKRPSTRQVSDGP